MINKDTKIFITGITGQLGYEFFKLFKDKGFNNVFSIPEDELDITKKEDVDSYFDKIKPEILIHCAAYTNVDKAEVEADKCFKVNVEGTRNLALKMKELNGTMVYFSTDYVFDGNGNNFFEIDDIKNPLSVYGKTKLEGENIVKSLISKYFICRVSWLFGINGNNFIKTMLRLSKTHDELNIVNDQIGSPTYAKDVAFEVYNFLKTQKYGTYHVTNEGVCSWAELAEFVFKSENIKIKVNKVSTEKYLEINKNAAKRPLNSRLSKKSLTDNGFNLLPTWEDATLRYLREIKEL